MIAGKRTADAAYDRTGYANVADKFVTCVQREGSQSITSDDCDNLLSLLAQCAALREALRAFQSAWDEYTNEDNVSLDRLGDAAILAHEALSLSDGAE